MSNSPWRSPLGTTSATRKRWHASMRACPICSTFAEVSRPGYCPRHRHWLDEVETEENRSAIDKSKAAPLMKPAPLPPRKPTRFE